MKRQLINERDLAFLLYEVLEVETLVAYPRYEDHNRETFDASLATAGHIAQSYFADHNRLGDVQEPHLENGKVVLIPQLKAALDAFVEAGFLVAHRDYEQGGIQLPQVVTQACFTYFVAANVSTLAYAFLTIAAGNLLESFGSPSQKERFLKPMLSGRFMGTMALTEPDAGSSLADITAQAEPQPEGHYHLTGSKIFISAGEHELAENIIHLVLARIKGAPAGIKGISLFIVPRYRVDQDGACGEDNDVALTGLLHKMGYRGTVSTVLNFGERGRCRAYLVGQANQGLSYMFQMMNEARIGVGAGATMLGYSAYLYALEYAKQRPQGRPHTQRGGAQVPIIRHADVRRMLLTQKAYVEGCLALCLYAALLLDHSQNTAEDQERHEHQQLLDLLTPIVKAWPSEYCLKANDLAIQVLGGYGYTREYPLEQAYRDNRLNPIHEGANGIQAIDLLGRKLLRENGAAFAILAARIKKTIQSAGELPELEPLAAALDQALSRVSSTVNTLIALASKTDPDKLLANASVFLDMMGRLVVGWMWLHQAVPAKRALAGPTTSQDEAFYRGKLQAARFFSEWELPQILHLSQLLVRVETSCYDMREDWF